MTTFWNGPIVCRLDTLKALASLWDDADVETWGTSRVRFCYRVNGSVMAWVEGHVLQQGCDGRWYFGRAPEPYGSLVVRLDSLSKQGKGSRSVSFREQEERLRATLHVPVYVDVMGLDTAEPTVVIKGEQP